MLLALAGGGQYGIDRYKRTQARREADEAAGFLGRGLFGQEQELYGPPMPGQTMGSQMEGGFLGTNAVSPQQAAAFQDIMRGAPELGQQYAGALLGRTLPAEPPDPTSLMRNMQAAGVDLQTPEGQAKMLEAIMKPQTQITNVPPMSLTDLARVQMPGGGPAPLGATLPEIVEAGGTLRPPEQTEYKEEVGKLDILKGAMSRYADMVNKHGTEFSLLGFNAEDTTELSSAYTSLMIQAKELFNLGVLQGPDMAIIEKALPDPTSLMNQRLSKQALINGINTLVNLLNDKYSALGATYGRKPSRISPFEAAKEDSENPSTRRWRRVP